MKNVIRRRSTLRAWLMAGGSIGCAMVPALAAAQDGGNLADTITVTATRRDDVTSQDVPASINVLGRDLLDDADVRSLDGIEELAPSVQITQTESLAAGTLISIRGIGTASNNPGFEPSVGVMIDGVFRTRTGIALSELPELNSVEILRGPQGTLFGRNTSSGAISINTAGPEFERSGSLTLAAGNLDAFTARGTFNQPLSEKWFSRVDATYRTRDGFIEDVNSDEDFNEIDRYSVRGQLLYVDDTSELRIIGDVGSADEPCCAAVVIDPGTTGPLVQAIAAPQGLEAFASSDIGDRETALSPNRPLSEEIDEWGVSAQYDRDLGSINFTSITSYRDWEVVRDQDVDGTGMDRSFRDDYTVSDQTFTQEFRLQGEYGLLNWLVGTYYLRQDLSLVDRIQVGPDAALYTDLLFNAQTQSQLVPTGFQVHGTLPGVPSIFAAVNPMQAGVFIPAPMEGEGQQADDFNVVTDAFALFTHNEWSLTERVTMTTGFRYTLEQKELDADLNSVSPTCDFLNANPGSVALLGAATGLVCSPAVNPEGNGSYEDDREDSQFSGTAKFAVQATDDLLLYTSYSRGFKSGGYNLARSGFDLTLAGGDGPDANDLEFDAETIDAYEVGFNSNFWGGKIILNGAAYFQDIDGFQNLIFNGNNFIVFNSPAESYGAELDLVARPIKGLTIQSGLAYNIAELTEEAVAGATVLDEGTQLPRSPEFTLTTSGTYNWPINSSFDGLLHLNSRFVTEQTLANAAPASDVEQDAFFLLGGRAGIQTSDGRWSLSVFGDNLLNEEYLLQSFSLVEQTGLGAYVGVPRTFGVEVRANF